MSNEVKDDSSKNKRRLNLWDERQLRDLLEKEEPGIWGDNPEKKEEGSAVLRATNFGETGIVLNDLAYRQIPKSKKDTKQLEPGDIILEKSGGSPDQPVGRVLFYNLTGEYYPGNFLRLLRPKDNELNSMYLYYRLDYNYEVGETKPFQTNTTNIRNLQTDSYLSQKVALPPLEEQRKIASVLYTVDQAIQKTEKIISQRETVKQGLMQDIFRYGVDSNGELRRSFDDEPYRDTKYGSAPKGWDIEPLDSIVPDDAPVTYGIVKPGDHHPGGVPVVKVENIMDGTIDQEDLLHTDPEIHEQYRRAELNEGDLLFTIRGTVGRMAFVPEELEDGNLTQDTARIRVDGANPRFVRYYLETATPSNYFERHTIGQAVQGINLEDLREVPVHLPSEEEQNRIVKILDSHTEQIRKERNIRERLQQLKKGLMQDLLSGEVRTHDKDIEIVDDVLAHG